MRLPKRPCSAPGCHELVSAGSRCDQHKQRAASRRPAIYGSQRWRKYSLAFLREHQLCCDPFDRHAGRVVPATVTGHRVAHRGDYALFWDEQNHYPLCAPCNSFQAAKSEGAFGNTTKLPAPKAPRIQTCF